MARWATSRIVPPGCLVDAARLHADEAVLDQVETADAVIAAEIVQRGQQLVRLEGLAVDGDRIAVPEADGDDGGGVGRLFGAHRALVDVRRRRLVRVLQYLALGGRVQKVGVDGERGLAALVLGDQDLVLLGEIQEIGPGLELPVPPRRDHLDVRVQGIGGQLEADLVVALAGGAMGDRVGAGLAGDLDEALGDQRPRDRGAQQIGAFVDGVGPEHREHEVAAELLAHVLDVDFLDARPLGLLAGRGQLLALAEIGGEGDDLRPEFGLQPLQDDRRVEAAGIGEHDLLDSTCVGHGSSSRCRDEECDAKNAVL
tara:strand:- start:1437 stop:2375 length:939 start_codon:yes stop_codon:yes gene_type:complete